METQPKQKINLTKLLTGHERLTKVDMLEILTALALLGFLAFTFIKAY